jgi:multiple sugar transport system permease protein
MTNATRGADGGAAAAETLQHRLVSRLRGSSLGVEARDRRDLWLMVWPAILVVVGFGIFPFVYSLWVSLHRWEPLSSEHPFLGLDNYREVLSDPIFHGAILRTAIFVAIVVPAQTLIGLGLALLVDGRPRLRRVFFPIFLVPILIAPIVVGYMWRQLWEYPNGPVNEVLSYLPAVEVRVHWLGGETTAFIALVVTEIWQWTPFMFVVLLAGLTGVPQQLREASAVDGATRWTTFRVVVLPALMPILTVAIVLRLLESANFYATVFSITQGGPGSSTYSLVYYIAKLAQFGRPGVAAAASFFFLLAVAIPTGILVMRLLRRQSELGGRT